ncbi:hypothetical protein LOY43_12110 [Pseudomonas sp. B21-041]|uniref:hypothetical protein n=1 Tax=Pseudomonas sp. B21-041 TaxID=2895487 RepID=UPI00215FCFB0|nr:hypothetical protein [Pseudomonas sp. B21-041]UVL37133.1 hypothetical protein LOY43_12110 [Pseudomonas sp. B21-041]
MMDQHPFPFDFEAGLVMQAFGKEVIKQLRELQQTYVDPRNVQRFVHGRSWQSHQSYDPDQVSELERYQHQMNVEFDDVMLRQLELIENTLSKLSNEMAESFVRSLYATVSDVCDKYGNVVSAGKEPAKAFIEMLEKIEFGVDRDGNVSMPQIHAGTAAIESFRRDSAMNSIDFENKIAEIKELKSAEALEKEAVRKAKFSKEQQ